MSDIDYKSLSDLEKIDLLRLLYHDNTDKNDRELIVAETQIVYNRLKKRVSLPGGTGYDVLKRLIK